jgi:hypothetical protein
VDQLDLIPEEPLDPIRRELQRESLRGSVQRAIFCPSCGNVLDMRRAVEVSAWKDSDCLKVVVVCAKCWDAHLPSRPPVPAEIKLEVLDGRELYR